MSARKATLLVMARMALADGTVSEQEKSFLAPLLGPEDDVEELLAQARDKTLAELIAPVESYADRFFIALRAASMAHVDTDFDAREEALYERLVTLLGIEESDRAVIDRSVELFVGEGPEEPEPRVEELYAQSSFA